MIKNDVVNYSKGWSNSDKRSLVKDKVYRGEVGTVLLGEAVDANDLLYPVRTALGTIAEWKQSNATVPATMPAQAIALQAGADGAYIKVMFKGYIKDIDFNYGTLATGTVVVSGTVTEGDRLVIDEDCFQMTALKGTTSAAKILATSTLSTTGVAVANELITIAGIVFEFTTDGVLTAGSHYNIDVAAGLTQAVWEPALEAAIDEAVTAGVLDVTYVSFAGNDLVITLGSSYVGLEQNAVGSTEGATNASFAAVTFLGGVPKVNWWVTGAGATLTIAEIKVALTAQLVLAIASGLEITQAAWSTNDLVLTSAKKGYEGNFIAMYEANAAGTKDAGANTTVSGTLMTGGVEGGVLYAAPVKGLLTLTNPKLNSIVQPVGYAIEAEKFFFNPMAVTPHSRVPITMPTKGAGFLMTGSTNFAMQYTDANGILVTELYIDITGNVPAGNTARDAIGTAAASYIFRYTVAAFGYVYLTEFICLELPAGSATITTDLDFEAEASGTIQKDGACSDEVLAASTGWVAGEKIDYTTLLVADRYIYLTEGDTAADGSGTYTGGQFLIRMFGIVPAAF